MTEQWYYQTWKPDSMWSNVMILYLSLMLREKEEKTAKKFQEIEKRKKDKENKKGYCIIFIWKLTFANTAVHMVDGVLFCQQHDLLRVKLHTCKAFYINAVLQMFLTTIPFRKIILELETKVDLDSILSITGTI